MGKRYKGKTCVYCGALEASATGDHVFAREFFPADQRDNLPQVPACHPCNRVKSGLEHYLTSVLPFASQHPEASKLLESKVPARLARNARLHRELAAGQGRVMMRERGIISPRMTIPFDGQKLSALFRMTLRGLTAFHWEVVIPQDYYVGAGILTQAGDQIMRDLFLQNVGQHAKANLADGLVLYEGVQALGNPALTIWRFQMYGGTLFGGDPEHSPEIISDIWALSAPTLIPGLFD